jgi:hypothetical protein
MFARSPGALRPPAIAKEAPMLAFDAALTLSGLSLSGN